MSIVEATRIHKAREHLSPAYRGALFYLGYWGIAGVYFPFVNVYFSRLGLSGREIGILAALLPLMTFVIGPPLSALADRRRWRVRLLAMSLLGLAVTLTLLALPRTFAGLVPLMLLLAVFRGPITSLADSLIVRMAARHRLDYGRIRLWGSLSFAVITTACGALWQRVGFAPMFVVAGVLFLPVAVCAAMLEEGTVEEHRDRRPLGDVGRDAGLIALLLATFLVGASLGMGWVFEGIYMDKLGGSELLVGALFGASALCELPSMRYGSAIAARLGGPNTLVLSYLFMGAGYLGYTLAWAPWMLLVLASIKGLGFGLFFVSTVRLIHQRAPAGWSSTLQAVMNALAFGLAQLLAGPTSGAIYDALGPKAVFAGCGIGVGLAAVIVGTTVVRGVFERGPQTAHSE